MSDKSEHPDIEFYHPGQLSERKLLPWVSLKNSDLHFLCIEWKRALLIVNFSEYLYFATVNSFKYTSLAFQMNDMKSLALWKVRAKRGKCCHGLVFAPSENSKTQRPYDKMLIDWVPFPLFPYPLPLSTPATQGIPLHKEGRNTSSPKKACVGD